AHQAHIGSRSCSRARPGICSIGTKRVGMAGASVAGVTAVEAGVTLAPGVRLGAEVGLERLPLVVGVLAAPAPVVRLAFACATARVQLCANFRWTASFRS